MLEDHARPLNERGQTSATAMGDWLRAGSYLPDQVLCSSAVRTRETLDLLNLDVETHFRKSLYHASADVMRVELQAATGNTVLMLGHNPGIAGFAHMLLGEPPRHPRFQDYPTCATLVADFDQDWNALTWGSGTCADFAVPREVLING